MDPSCAASEVHEKAKSVETIGPGEDTCACVILKWKISVVRCVTECLKLKMQDR